MPKYSAFGAMLGFMVALFALAPSAPAGAQEPDAGKALAERWCAACHAVGPGEGGSDAVPSFERIAKEREPTEQWLTLLVTEPHQSMPSLSLTRQEIADLVAYFDSLRGAQ